MKPQVVIHGWASRSLRMSLGLYKKQHIVGAYANFSVERVQYFQQILKGVLELLSPTGGVAITP